MIIDYHSTRGGLLDLFSRRLSGVPLEVVFAFVLDLLRQKIAVPESRGIRLPIDIPDKS